METSSPCDSSGLNLNTTYFSNAQYRQSTLIQNIVIALWFNLKENIHFFTKIKRSLSLIHLTSNVTEHKSSFYHFGRTACVCKVMWIIIVSLSLFIDGPVCQYGSLIAIMLATGAIAVNTHTGLMCAWEKSVGKCMCTYLTIQQRTWASLHSHQPGTFWWSQTSTYTAGCQ